MEFKQYLTILRKWWWLFVICVLVSSGFSYYGTRQLPRIYRATTTVMIGQAMQQANPSNMDIYISEQLAQTYAEMVKRTPILAGAAEALGLNYVPSSGTITTRQVPGTQLLEISVQDTDTLRAKALADEIANQLIIQSPAAGESQKRGEFIEEQLAELETKIQVTEDEIEGEEEKLDASNSARAIQQYQTNINALEQKRSTYQYTYANLLLTTTGGSNYITIVEPAKEPTTPISPNVTQTVLLSAAIGLGLAVGGAVLIEFLDDTIKSTEEAQAVLGVANLASIPELKEMEPRALVTLKQPLHPVSEAFRNLRTSVQFANLDSSIRTLLITSPTPTDGKSFIAANLAVALAQERKNVVLLDTDLRHPTINRIMGMSKDPGLTNLLYTISEEGNIFDRFIGIEAYFQSVGEDLPSLSVLASGKNVPNPAEVLGSQIFQDLISWLHDRYDIVVIDSPPLLAVTDAVVVATQVDGVAMVINAGETHRAAAIQAMERLNSVGAKVLGLIMNRMSSERGGYYYYYYHRYPYGDGNGSKSSGRKNLLDRFGPVLRKKKVSEPMPVEEPFR